MRRIDMKVLLPILGLGALAFALGSSKKSAQPAPAKTTGAGTGTVRVSASDLYPSSEGTGDVSDQAVPGGPVRLVPIKAQKANGAS